MNNKLSFIFLNLLLIITAEPPLKHFFIEENGIRCALFDLSAEVLVEYETKNSQRATVTLDLSKAAENQFGSCSSSPDEKFVIFNISLSNTEILHFRFANQSDVVEIDTIGFLYTTPDNDFPNAKINGTFYEYSHPKLILSNTNGYYKCLSTLRFSLTNGTSFQIYNLKVKVFNVENNSFGNIGEECPQDSMSSSTSSTPITTHTTKISTHESDSTTHERVVTTATSDSSTHTTQSSTKGTTLLSTSGTVPSEKTSVISTLSTLPMPTTITPTNTLNFGVYDNSTGYYCLLMKSQLTINIQYPMQDNKIGTASFFIQSNATYNGTCSMTVDAVTIHWVSGLQITFLFLNKDKSSTLNNITIMYTMTPQYFKGSAFMNQTVYTNKDINDCQVSIGNFYGCDSLSYNIENTTLTLKEFQYEAFRQSKTRTFDGLKTQCGVRNPLVAIIVGVVLAAFLIIVVVLFFIFRFRANKRRGYEEI